MQRKFLACAACLTLSLQIAGRAARGDATAFQNDPAHDGSVVMPDFHPIPSILYTVNTGQTFAYPLIVGNQIIVNCTNQLQAYNAANGSLNWSTNAGPAPRSLSGSGPAYDNGMVFLNAPSTLTSTQMSAFSVSNGQKIWSTVLPGQVSFSSPVTASNGSAYTGGSGTGGDVYSLRESDGALQWAASVANGDNSAPTVTSDGVFVSYLGPNTYKLNVSNGSTTWKYGGLFEGGAGDTSVYYNNRLYITEISSDEGPRNQLVALNAIGGLKLYDLISGAPSDPVSPPAFFNGSGFVAAHNQLIGFNINDGSISWTQNLDGSSLSAPLAINGYVYDETANGNLFVLNGADGTVVDELNLGSTTFPSGGFGYFAGMAASDGILAVPDGQNLVVLSVPEPTGVAGLIFAAALLLPRRRFRTSATEPRP